MTFERVWRLRYKSQEGLRAPEVILAMPRLSQTSAMLMSKRNLRSYTHTTLVGLVRFQSRTNTLSENKWTFDTSMMDSPNFRVISRSVRSGRRLARWYTKQTVPPGDP